MKEFRFLSLEDVMDMHARGLADHGGQEGVRDEAALESAVMHPQNLAIYGGGDVFEIGAAYAFHIAESQAFIDGNKRAGMGAAFSFLRLNGYRVRDPQEELYQAMIDIANRRIDRQGLAAVLRKLSHEV